MNSPLPPCGLRAVAKVWRAAARRPRELVLCCAAPALAALGGAALAEEPTRSAERSSVLPTVIIATPAKLPHNQSVDASARAASRSDTAALLAEVPGAAVMAGGAVSGLPALRGLADDRLTIKVDGMDLIGSCPNHMNPALSYLDPTQVGVLTVYAGITPVSVGGDSIGGSVIAESAAPEFAAAGAGPLTKGEAGSFWRSNNRARGASLATTFATADWSLHYSGANSRADNYTAGGDFKNYVTTGRLGQTLPRNEVGSTGYETRNHALSLAYRNDGHVFDARVSVQDMPYQLYPNQRMDLTGNRERSINLAYTGSFDWGRVQARVYQQSVDHEMEFGPDKRFWYGMASGGPSVEGRPCAPIGATCAAGMPMKTEAHTLGAHIKTEIELAPPQLLRIGAEAQHYRIDDEWPPSGSGMWPGTFWNVRDGRRDRLGAYAEWEGRLATDWVGQVGARLERVAMDAGDVAGYNPAGGGFQGRDAAAFNVRDHRSVDLNKNLAAIARWNTTPTQYLEFGIAHKERSPSVYERFPWSTWSMAALMNNLVGDGNGYIGNLDLRPEKADTLAATCAWNSPDKRAGLQVTPYYTWVADYIDAQQWNAANNQPAAVPAKGQFVVLKYVNQPAQLHGVDLSGHLPIADTGWGEFGFKGLLSYTRGSNRDTGDGLVNIMPLNARLSLTQKLGAWDGRAEWVLVRAKTDRSAVRNEVATPGYALLNLRGSYEWPRVRLDVGLENVFNRLYYLPTGGAYVGQGLTMMAMGIPPWGTAVPGMGRNGYVALKFKF